MTTVEDIAKPECKQLTQVITEKFEDVNSVQGGDMDAEQALVDSASYAPVKLPGCYNVSC